MSNALDPDLAAFNALVEATGASLELVDTERTVQHLLHIATFLQANSAEQDVGVTTQGMLRGTLRALSNLFKIAPDQLAKISSHESQPQSRTVN